MDNYHGIPMYVVSRKGIRLDGSHAVLLEGYGGSGASMQPFYRHDTILWLELGGIFALPNIRGGGEYGLQWHRAGMRENEQNSIDDFIAAGEFLIREGFTSREKLGITVYSNGGMLVGAALAQRPDLFGAAIPQAGHYDMLRYHLFTNARFFASEYGTSEKAAEFRYLYKYSPLHNVKNTCYPPTLIVAREQDDRVAPVHAYKFAAMLQAVQTCSAPVLLRTGAGSHNFAAADIAAAEVADVLSFAAVQLGARREDSGAAPARMSHRD